MSDFDVRAGVERCAAVMQARTGLAVHAERDIMRNEWTLGSRLPKIRHVPRPVLLVGVSSATIEDAISVDALAESLALTWGHCLDDYRAHSAEQLQRRSRKVRAARKRRRGWA